MYKIDGIKVALGENLTKKHIAERIGIADKDILSFKILRKAIDARRKNNVHYVYSAAAETAKTINGCGLYEEEKYIFPEGKPLAKRPVIAGSGPGGLFAALVLAENGYKPILVERGADVDARLEAVEKFRKTGVFDKVSNMQFGEGGAGTFSDGKLNSGINDKRCRYVLETFVKYGAPEEIAYDAKPHIGTDILPEVVKNIRRRIEDCGGEVRFLTSLCGLEVRNGAVCGVEIETVSGKEYIETDTVILAVGHSARDTYRMLKTAGVAMEQKNFSVGVRIEHRQEMVNKSQYADAAKLLGPADYKLAAHFDDGRSAYTFCMCPGGVVVASNSEEGAVVTNGMSNYARDGKNANSALLVNVRIDDFPSEDVLAGVEFQEMIEKKAFAAGGGTYAAPCQYVGDFMGYEVKNKVMPTYMPGVKFCEIAEIFPDFVTETIRKALKEFDRKLKGFADGGAVMTAPETRSSAPVRILRSKETGMSNICGIYPCGEGAGYAGGIMSAAVDGIKIAEFAARGR